MELNLTNEFHDLRKAFLDPAKYVVIAAGRRSGKTYEAFDWLYRELLTQGAKTALWVDTRHSNIDKYVDRYCKPRLAEIWSLCQYNQQRKILELPNKAYIDFGSAEKAQNLEGFEYDRIIINEGGIALHRPSLWDNTIQPMTKGPKNKTRVIGTPKGKNKFFRLFRQYKGYHFTAMQSPYWSQEELNDIKTQVPAEVWRQEYLAEFIEGAGTVFRNVANCINDIQYEQGREGIQYVMGVDLAKHEDFTVIVIAERETNQVIHIDKFNQIDWQFQKKRIYSLWQRFNQPKVVIDSTGVGDAIYDDLSKSDINIEPYKFTSKTKTDLIQNLSVAIDNVNIKFPPIEDLINELETFSYEMSATGNIRYNAPQGLHDDMVIALALTNYALKTTKTFDISWI